MPVQSDLHPRVFPSRNGKRPPESVRPDWSTVWDLLEAPAPAKDPPELATCAVPVSRHQQSASINQMMAALVASYVDRCRRTDKSGSSAIPIDTGGEFVRAEPEGARRPNAWCVPKEYPPASPPLARSQEPLRLARDRDGFGPSLGSASAAFHNAAHPCEMVPSIPARRAYA